MTGTRDPLIVVLEWGLVCIVIFAPLPFASVVPQARLALEAAAAVLLIVWLVRAMLGPLLLPPRSALIGIVGLVLLATVQIAPLGRSWTAALSPRSVEIPERLRPDRPLFESENRFLGLDAARFERPPRLSLAPEATASALRSGAAYAVFLLVATSVARARGVGLLAAGLLLSAFVQAAHGLFVLVSGYDQIWHVPKRYYLASTTGTYVNRNHFAGMLAAALPSGLTLAWLQARRRKRRSGAGWRERILEWGTPEGQRALVLGAMLVVGVAGLILSLSRAGVTLGLVALVGTALMLNQRGRRRRLVALLLAVSIALVPLSQIGFEKLTGRFVRTASDLTAAGGRAIVWHDSLAMGLDFPLVGTGFGTFATLYPLYRSPSVRLFYDHAHNDLVQLWVEGGAIAMLFVALLLAPLARKLVPALSGGLGPLAVGIGAGLSALLLHALVDFNFHIPANAAIAAVLTGSILGLPWNVSDSSSSERPPSAP